MKETGPAKDTKPRLARLDGGGFDFVVMVSGFLSKCFSPRYKTLEGRILFPKNGRIVSCVQFFRIA